MSTFVADSGFHGLTDPRKLPCTFNVTKACISLNADFILLYIFYMKVFLNSLEIRLFILKTEIVESKATMTVLAGKKQAGNQKFLSTLIIQYV